MTLESRVVALEKSASRWRRATVLLSASFVVAMAVAATTTPDVVRANRVEVIRNGEPRIILDGKTGTATFLDASASTVLRIPASSGRMPPVAGRARTKLEARRAIKMGMTQAQVRQILGEVSRGDSDSPEPCF